jgi:hypothetical protein
MSTPTTTIRVTVGTRDRLSAQARQTVADIDTAGSTARAAESTARATGRGPAATKAGSPSGQSKARSAACPMQAPSPLT